MFTDIISNITNIFVGNKPQPKRTRRVKRAANKRKTKAATVSRTIRVNGEAFEVGIHKSLNQTQRRQRLRMMAVGEEQVFLDRNLTIHKEVIRLKKGDTKLSARDWVINPAHVEGKRIPRTECCVVTRVK